MPQPQLVDMLNKWDQENNGIQPEDSNLAARFEILALRLLAEGRPVSSGELANRLNVPAELVKTVFEKSQGVEGEWDEEGRLIGNALSLVPTQHRIKVKGNDLFAWCAFDALLIPSLVNETVEVESPDPITGDSIQMVITPSGTKELRPSTTVISIVLTGAEATGPESDFCNQTHFFTSKESAEIYRQGHPDVTIISVEEAEKLVQEQVLTPMVKAIAEINSV